MNNKFIELVKPYLEAEVLGKALLDEKITGLVIEDFLSTEECEKIVEQFNQIELSSKTIVNKGFDTFPLSFAQYTQLKDSGQMCTEDYVVLAKKFRDSVFTLFGIDLENRLIACFNTFFPDKHCSLLKNEKYDEYLVPFNFRELKPGFGELVTHCENLFFTEFPSFFNWLSEHGVKNNQFSFFVTLQNTELGGELCCYNLSWDTVKERVNFDTLKDVNGNEIRLDDQHADKFKIKPKIGSLLLFNGGNIWHRVEKVAGPKSRITVGGFVSSSKQKNDGLLMWA